MLPIGHKRVSSLGFRVTYLFSIKVADRETERHIETSTDNKGRLKACSARANNDIDTEP